MIPRYLQIRPSRAKTFSQTSMTIPGLAVDIPSAIAAVRRGEPCRQHSSGSYDEGLTDPAHVSPFQRGFELTDFASTKAEASSLLKVYEQQYKSRQKNVDSHAPAAPPAEPAERVDDEEHLDHQL